MRTQDLQLDTLTGDIVLDKGRLVLTEGVDAVAQRIRMRLATWRGEWFLDRGIGVPYYQKLLQRVRDPAGLRTIFRDAILGTEGVASVPRLEVDLDAAARRLTVRFTAVTDSGDETEGEVQV